MEIKKNGTPTDTEKPAATTFILKSALRDPNKPRSTVKKTVTFTGIPPLEDTSEDTKTDSFDRYAALEDSVRLQERRQQMNEAHPKKYNEPNGTKISSPEQSKRFPNNNNNNTKHVVSTNTKKKQLDEDLDISFNSKAQQQQQRNNKSSRNSSRVLTSKNNGNTEVKYKRASLSEEVSYSDSPSITSSRKSTMSSTRKKSHSRSFTFDGSGKPKLSTELTKRVVSPSPPRSHAKITSNNTPKTMATTKTSTSSTFSSSKISLNSPKISKISSSSRRRSYSFQTKR
eukprot:TRINITY_DN4534_c0_g1_i1.p1 TRINITY_DN4534_c0_g1~~TRINITY_DN4534_c0_g1_i1.p1  ORF type:complete len:285 (+),score=38.09 TRINITY_DN4534_c0_g1_i1:204-1058(+)